MVQKPDSTLRDTDRQPEAGLRTELPSPEVLDTSLGADRASTETAPNFWHQVAFENSAEGIAVVTPRLGLLTDGNRAFCAMFGYARSELAGLRLAGLQPADADPKITEKLIDLRSGAIPACENVPCRKKDGSPFVVRLRATGVGNDPSGPVLLFFADITNELGYSAALRESQERWQYALEGAGDGVWDMDCIAGRMFYSPRALAMLGYQAHQVDNTIRQWEEALHPEDHDAVMTELRKHFSGALPNFSMEYRLRRGDGSYRWLQVRGKVMRRAPDGSPIRMLGTVTDIEERKTLQQGLLDEIDRRRLLVDQSRDGIVVLDGKGAVFEANQRFAEMLGYTTDEARTLHVWDWDTQWSKEELLAMTSAVDTGGDHFETRHRRKDGTVIEVEISTNGAFIDGQKLIFCVCRDISDRKSTQRRLEYQEHLLSQTGELAKVGGWQFDPSTGEGTWTDEVARIHDLPVGAATNREIGLSHFHGEDRLKVENAVREAVECGKPYDLEVELHTAAGRTKWVRTIGSPVIENGKVIQVRGSIQDISDRKLAEVRRQRNLERQKNLNHLQNELLGPEEFSRKVQLVADSVLEIFGAAHCQIWCQPLRADARDRVQESFRFVPAAVSGRKPDARGDRDSAERFWQAIVEQLAATDADSLLYRDGAVERDIPGRDWLAAQGLEALAAYTLRLPTVGPIGALVLAFERPISAEEDSQLKALRSAVSRVISSAAADEALRVSEERYRTVADHTFDWEYWITPDRMLSYCSPSCRRISGYEPDEFIANPTLFDTIVHPQDRAVWDIHNEERDSGGQMIGFRIVTKAGAVRWIEHVCSPVHSDTGHFLGWRASNRDVTDRIHLQEEKALLERQYHQAQKMEAIGHLAGGVAHDFNNLLQVIIGYNQILADDLDPDHPALESVREIQQATERARLLVGQLLTFSRRKPPHVEPVDLNGLLVDLLKMLGRLLGEHVEIRFEQGGQPVIVRADRTLIEQIVVNLCVNSRDAMPNGGLLTLSVHSIPATEIDAAGMPGVVDGRVCVLAIEDTGCGISPEALDHIFEPFYTTKDIGKGTGLGLATVYGAVKQMGGLVRVSSEVGQGTRFSVVLPLVTAHETRVDCEPDAIQDLRGSQTVLLAEDDATVRQLAEVILRAAGYTVISAANGEEAITIFRQQIDLIDLLLLDMVMPKMGGKEVRRLARLIRPDIPVLFASGYDPDTLSQSASDDIDAHVLAKPYRREQLLRAIRDLLASGATHPGKADCLPK